MLICFFIRFRNISKLVNLISSAGQNGELFMRRIKLREFNYETLDVWLSEVKLRMSLVRPTRLIRLLQTDRTSKERLGYTSIFTCDKLN